jgi:hypothetical protein
MLAEFNSKPSELLLELNRDKVSFYSICTDADYQFELLSVKHNMITPYPATLVCNIINKRYSIEEEDST